MNNNPYNPLAVPDSKPAAKRPLTHQLAAAVLMLIGAGATFVNLGLLATSFLLMADRDGKVPSGQLAIGFSIWLLAGLCLIKASRDFWQARPSAGVRAIGVAIMIAPIPILLFS